MSATIRPSGGDTAISYDLDSVEHRASAVVDDSRRGVPPARFPAAAICCCRPITSRKRGDGELSAAGLTFTSPFAQAPIRLGDGHSKFKLDHGTLTIEEFTTSGGDLILTAEGTIQLAPDPGDSELAIEFTLSTAPAAAAQLGGTAHDLAASPRPAALSPDRHPKRPANQLTLIPTNAAVPAPGLLTPART